MEDLCSAGGRAQKDWQPRGRAFPGWGSLAASRPPLTSQGWAIPGSAAVFFTNFVEVLVSLHCGEEDLGPSEVLHDALLISTPY